MCSLDLKFKSNPFQEKLFANTAGRNSVGLEKIQKQGNILGVLTVLPLHVASLVQSPVKLMDPQHYIIPFCCKRRFKGRGQILPPKK